MPEFEDLKYISDLVYRRCRVRLHEGKHHLIRARLAKRLRHYGFADLHEYCQFLRRQADEAELGQVVDALTTNFTHFLREPDHFSFLVDQALPELLRVHQRSFQVWSAACATGEEPFSIAFQLAERYPPLGGWNWRVLATDISGKALEQARRAVYPQERLAGLPRTWVQRYFERGLGPWEGYCRVKGHIAERVDFRQLNLLSDYRFADHFAVIFCRNVMIYFDRPTQETLVNRLRERLVPRGYLLVGHSESLIGLNSRLRCRRPSVYQEA